jgi:hypothetical protein
MDETWVKPEIPRSQRRKADMRLTDYPASLSREVVHLGIDADSSGHYPRIENACGKPRRKRSYYIEGVSCLLCLLSYNGRLLMEEADAIGVPQYE